MEKNLHFLWLNDFSHCPPELLGNPARWRALNPGWQLMLWNRADILKFVSREYPMLLGIFRVIEETSTEKVAAVKQSDLARLLILHHYGGAYVDMDCAPLLPLSSLFGEPFGSSPEVRHRFTPFTYARGDTPPTVLDPDAPADDLAEWGKYSLIFSREHQPDPELGTAKVSNAVIIARKGSSLLADIISRLIPHWNEQVLKFCGPHAITKALLELSKTEEHKGKAYVLPPHYLTWQPHDQGEPWERAIAIHENQLSWCDFSKPVPWAI